MKKIKSIQLKAALLLMVFSLNTIIGFACAVGLDMGFNSHHHDEEVTEIPVHVHAYGKMHSHNNEIKNHHEEAEHQLHKTANDKDDCCHDKATQIAQLDKAIPGSFSITGNSIFFTSFVSSFYIDPLVSTGIDTKFKYFVRSHHPPIPDIRIAIQSFQI